MKRVFLLLLVLFFSIPFFAQKKDTSTVSVTTEIGVLEEQELVKDYVFLTQKNARYLFKINLFQNGLGIERTYGRSLLAFETKIGRSFSVNLGATIGGAAAVNESTDSSFNFTVIGFVNATLEPRFYYRQAQRIRENKSGNNLSDNYFSLFSQKSFFFQTGEAADSLLSLQPNLRLGVGWGIQRRMFKRGYFDIGLLATATRIGFEAPKWYFGIAPRAVLGLGFGPEKYDPTDATQCAAFRCFVEERRQTRLNLIDLFGFSNLPNNEFLTSKLTAEHETRLGQSVWSATGGLILHGERGKSFTISSENGVPFVTNQPFEKASVNASVEFRNYYKMKKKVRLGQAAKNFSGPFKVWRAETEYAWRNQRVRLPSGDLAWRRADDFSAHLGWGWGYQRRILEHGYFSFKAIALLGLTKDVSSGDLNFDSRLHIPVAFGLAF